MAIKFEKVSFEQYFKDRNNNSVFPIDEETARYEYDNFVTIPKRSTSGSAGYDFCAPFSFNAWDRNEKTVIPTGIRIMIEPEDNKNLVLCIYPRSGLGFKYMMRLCNTVGIIDSDYYYANNEGHIMIATTSEHRHGINQGDRFAQGILQEYFVVDNDDATNKRTGGMGSTGN